MTRNLQAYFPTESDAADARVRLQANGASDIEMSDLNEGVPREVPLIAPYSFGAMNGSAAYGTGIPAAPASVLTMGEGGAAGHVIEEDQLDRNTPRDRRPIFGVGPYSLDLFDGDRDGLNHVLAAKVPDDRYEEIVDYIRANKGYVTYTDEED
ncbi:hypothetical protein [Gorillibacterium massiliense]|uniref:hypothetical protein n=1 Tax=Gorillibacterium massiliense TaxID=1280390 RepID=UPI0004B33221|nr:hypothetical protein [Gorillibacterium massiliense]